MAASPMSKVVGHLRRMAFLQECVGFKDENLLETFLIHRKEAAFEALVRRHGPMVLGVCRRVLQDLHDAEDAFQATFLVLIRKAASISKRELLANWLHGVAHRTALKARKATARRRARERQVEGMAQKQVTQDETIQEMLPLLDQELSRLPDNYRVPIILCDLEGKTRREAAKQLDLPERTLSTRLARARVMLAKRLTRHGTIVSGSALAMTVSQNMASASVPPSFVSSTVKIGNLVVAGKTAALGAVSASVVALTKEELKSMLFTKLKIATAALLLVLVMAGVIAGGLLYRTQASEQPQPQQAKAPPAQEEGEAKLVVIRDTASIHGLAYRADGKIVATAGITYEFIEVKEGDKTTKELIRNSTVKLWDAKTGKLRRSLGEEKHTHIRPVVFSPDGKTMALAAAKPAKAASTRLALQEVRLVDTTTWALTRKIEVDGWVICLAFSSDGKTLAFGGGYSPRAENGSFVKLWDMEKGKVIGGTKEQKPEANAERGQDKEGSVIAIAFSPDGKLLAAGERDGKMSLFDGRTGELKQMLDNHEGEVGAIAFSPDGKTFASGGDDRTVKLWDVQTAKVRQKLEGNKAYIHAVAFSPDGKFLATGGPAHEDGKDFGEVMLWDARTGRLKHTVSDQTGAITTLEFSPDGKTLAIGRGIGGDPSNGGKATGEVRLMPLESLLQKSKE